MRTRNLDHLVLVTDDLDQNRKDLTRFGFRVAPNGIHPFGTKNACIFFQDGTYFEPLAVHNSQIGRREMAKGNVFVCKYRDYTTKIANYGFSGIALASDSVVADEALFGSHNILLGPTFSFSRALKGADGAEKIVRFHMNFVDGGNQDQFLGFAIQREVPLPNGKNDLTSHPNGVIGIKRLHLQTHTPENYRHYLSVLTGDQTPKQTDKGIAFQIGDRKIIVSKADATTQPSESLKGVAIELKVMNLDETALYFSHNQSAYVENNQKILLHGKAQLGYDLIFSE